MRIPTSNTQRESLSASAMTPMIDVVFLLLVFFVCAATGRPREAFVSADLPAGGIPSPDTPREKPLLGEAWIYLRTAPGGVTAELEGNRYSDLTQLETALRRLAAVSGGEIPVILDIGDAVAFGDMMRTYDACRSARFQSINFAVGTGTSKKTPAE